MPTPIGPNTMPVGEIDLLTQCTQAITISGDQLMSSYFTCGFARRIYVDALGDVYIKRRGDTAFTAYHAVPVGTYLDGIILAVGGSTTAAVIAEL
jgi:hypothetical protein